MKIGESKINAKVNKRLVYIAILAISVFTPLNVNPILNSVVSILLVAMIVSIIWDLLRK